MSELRISPQLALPADVAGEAIAILAKRGAGKTNTATVLVEELHAAGVQVVILDPVGAWWGIRSSASGKGEGLPIPILGGQHGDVPLEPTAGVVAADVVVDNGASLLLDLSDFPSKTAHARFVVDFAERLFRRKAHDRTLVHLVLEEADAFAPQTKAADVARMKGAIEQIVRRGRSRGLGVTMITQRSAVLDKDVLEQTDLLIVMRTTGPNDRKAIERWIDVHADKEEAQVVLDSLASLKTGEAWIWNPERGLLDRAQIRARKTFDSSSTPKAGERRAAPKKVAAIDLEALGAEISATAERAKANDPRELRRKVEELEHALGNERAALTFLKAQEQPEPERVVERVEVPVFNGEVEQLADAVDALRSAAGTIATAAEQVSKAVATAAQLTKEALHVGHDASRAQAAPARARENSRTPRQHHSDSEGARRAEGGHVRQAPPQTRGEFQPSGPQQRILNALAALAAIGAGEADKTQLALFAEASPKSSSYSNNLGALRSAGLIDYPAGGRVTLTAEGNAIADPTSAPTSVAELHDFVFRLVGAAKARLLQTLIDVYPEALPKAELAERAGASPSSSSFSNNLGALRSLRLIDYPGAGLVAALPVLFMEHA